MNLNRFFDDMCLEGDEASMIHSYWSSWEEFVALKDDEGDVLNLVGMMEEDGAVGPIILAPNPYDRTSAGTVSYQYLKVGDRKQLRCYAMQVSNGYFVVGLRCIMGSCFTKHFDSTEICSWLVESVADVPSHTEDLGDYLGILN